MTLRLVSACTGYGGLDMAVGDVLDVDLVAVADPAPGAATLLDYRYPGVPNFGDITQIDWSGLACDVFVAGFPCQDISSAGRRAGIQEGTRSGLWLTIANALRVLRPRFVFLENVSAILVRGLDRVLADLAALGYRWSYRCLPASAVGAPHRRDRWFLVADAGHGTVTQRPRAARREVGERFPVGSLPGRPRQDAAHAVGVGLAGGEPARGHHVPAWRPDRWGQYGPAIDQWERVTGRPAPEPTEEGRRGPRLAPLFVEWLMGLPQGWVTAVPGLSRTQQLQLLGNGVVPLQAEAAFRSLLPSLLPAVGVPAA